MFKCEKCSSSALKPKKIVVERKMVNHLHGEAARGPRGGMGSQIVREMTLCDGCASTVVEAPIEHNVVAPRPKQPSIVVVEAFDDAA